MLPDVRADRRDDREGIPTGCAHHRETRNVLTEQTNLLSDVLADTDIFLPFEPLIQDIQHRLLSGDKPLPVDPPHVLRIYHIKDTPDFL
jgi:hypothetical protein